MHPQSFHHIASSGIDRFDNIIAINDHLIPMNRLLTAAKVPTRMPQQDLSLELCLEESGSMSVKPREILIGHPVRDVPSPEIDDNVQLVLDAGKVVRIRITF